MTPFLSDRIKTEGYAKRPAGRRRGIEWGDKDFALNAWDVHHLHLAEAGSKALLYVLFDREAALAVMLGDHKSFDNGALERRVLELRARADHMVLKGVAGLSSERTAQERQYLARNGITTLAMVDGKAVIGASIATDGSSDKNIMLAMRMLRKLRDYDNLADDPTWLSNQVGGRPFLHPQWVFCGTDLALVSEDATVGINVQQGRC